VPSRNPRADVAATAATQVQPGVRRPLGAFPIREYRDDHAQNLSEPISNPLDPDGSEDHADEADVVEAMFINRPADARTDRLRQTL
jgi:hypothetical protein